MSRQFQMDRDWLVYHPSPSKPRSCRRRARWTRIATCSGPGDEFPYAPERKYTPCDAPKEKLWELRDYPRLRAQRDRAGDVSRRRQSRAGRCAARLERPRARRRDGDARLHRRAAARARCRRRARRAVQLRQAAGRRHAARSAGRDRRTHRSRSAGTSSSTSRRRICRSSYDFFASLPTIVVVDHMGRPDVTQPLTAPGFELFVKLMRQHEQHLVEGQRRRAPVAQRSAGLRRLRAVRAPHRRDVPGPRAVGHRLAAPEPEDAHARRRPAGRPAAAHRADASCSAEAARRQPACASTGSG